VTLPGDVRSLWAGSAREAGVARRTLCAWWALAIVACGHPPQATSAATSASPDPGAQSWALDQAFGALEGRLLVDQARVRFWQEMRERHESVSALAAVNLERHAESVARRAGRERAGRDTTVASTKRNRVAARIVPTAQSTR
jgi:hypothetical protein